MPRFPDNKKYKPFTGIPFSRAEMRALITLAFLLVIGSLVLVIQRGLVADESDVDLSRMQEADSLMLPQQSGSSLGNSQRTAKKESSNFSSRAQKQHTFTYLNGDSVSVGEQQETSGMAQGTEKGLSSHGLLDINAADVADFQQLPGVGPVLAGRIVDFRREHGAFKKVEDLLLVRGVGAKRFEKIKPLVRV